VGADGVVFLDKPKNKENTYKWDFYNSDGSNAEACMNASRCVVLYAKEIEKKKQPIKFETRSGVMVGRVVSGGVELELVKFFNPQKNDIYS
jgi:diaminopimelate epimerase